MMVEGDYKKDSKGQAMIEYMALMGLAILLLLAVLYTFVSYMGTTSTQMNLDSAQKTVKRIQDKSNFVYIHGHPARTETRISIPPNVEDIDIHDDLVRLRLSVASPQARGNSYTDIHGLVRGNLSSQVEDRICNPTCVPGDYVLSIKHMPGPGNKINITVK